MGRRKSRKKTGKKKRDRTPKSRDYEVSAVTEKPSTSEHDQATEKDQYLGRLIRRSSNSKLLVALKELDSAGGNGWLDRKNEFLQDSTRALENIDLPSADLDTGQFCEFLAVSVFVHSGDAWGYFGRALNCYMQGDMHAAVHLLYYSELRAALAILGADGIHVGNGRNCLIDKEGQVQEINKSSTHEATWRIFRRWYENDSGLQLIERSFRPAGISIEDWLDSLTGSVVTPFLGEIFRLSSSDLMVYDQDRRRRNEASYVPTKLVQDSIPVDTVWGAVVNIWDMLDPRAGSFSNYDFEFVASLMAAIFKRDFGEGDYGPKLPGDLNRGEWEEWVDNHLPSDLAAGKSDIIKEINPFGKVDRSPFYFMTKDDGIHRPSEFLEAMMLRALFLLRLASASSQVLVMDSGISLEVLIPWVKMISESRGLDLKVDKHVTWPEKFEDIDDAIEEIIYTKPTSTAEFATKLAPEMLLLGRSELVLMWAIRDRLGVG